MENHSTLASATQQTPLGKHSSEDVALDWARKGFRVFPLAKNSKRPALAESWKKIATRDPELIGFDFTRDDDENDASYNVGIALDTNVFALDIDVRDGKLGEQSFAALQADHGVLPKTLTQRTATGGRHVLFRTDVPVANSTSKVAPGIDVKSAGGYLVAAGSVINGNAYELIEDVPIAPAPDWLIELLQKPRERSNTDTATPLIDLDNAESIKRATDYLINTAPEAIEGQGGDNTTIRVANRVGDFGISPNTALDLLLEHWNEAKAIPPWDPDDLEAKVRSAFKSRQNQIGVASAEAEFQAVEMSLSGPQQGPSLTYIDWADARADFDRPYLIDGLVDLGAMVVTYGDSNVGKTFVKLDQCFHIAAGRDWNGHKVKQGLVVYIAAEGGKGFLKRIEAFKRHYKVEKLPFVVIPCPVDLFSPRSDARHIVEVVKGAEQRHGQKCALIVIDTLARAMANGDENTATDMGRFVANCDRLRQLTGATVDIIHHTGKDKAKGARGSSALRAATDTELEIDRGVVRTAKQRDLEVGPDRRFELVSVPIGNRSDGKPATSCVVRWIAPEEIEFAAPIDARLEEALAAFETALDGREIGGSLLSFTEWTNAYATARSARGKTSGAKQALVRCSKGLIEAGYIAKTKDGQYVRTSAK